MNKVVKKSASMAFKRNLLVASITVSMLTLSGCGQETVQPTLAPTPKPALTEIVSIQSNDNLSFNGIIRAAERADLAFRVGGRLISISVKEGDEVKKGQVLATLDPRDAKTALASAELEHKNSKLEYDRAKTIFKKSQAISISDLDAITTRYNLAGNHVDEAKRQLEYTELKAPFDGFIGRKLVDNYVQIQANTPLLTLHDLSDLEVVINVPHNVVLSGTNSTKANAVLSSIPGVEFPLTLRTFATEPDPISQTYPVALGFSDLKGYPVLPGMAVKVIPAKDNTTLGSMSIPLTALVPDNQGKQFVWVVDESNNVSKRYVDVGTLSKDRIIIKDKLNRGERIIIAGVSSIKEGMEVRPYTDERSGGQ